MMTMNPLAGRRSVSQVWLRALELTGAISKNPVRILPSVIGDLAEERGHAAALLSDTERLTYRTLAERADQYARWARAQQLAKGDVVSLFMPNSPEYMVIWLGLTGAGCAVSLINTHLIGRSLAHCINIVNPKHIVVSNELIDSFMTAVPDLKPGARFWVHGEAPVALPRIDENVEMYADFRACSDTAAPTIQDTALYIYTSGTTGLPKAARVSHYRLMQWTHWFAGLMDISSSDRMYNCLPMYHSVGGVLATGAVLVGGGSVVIRDRFSAHQFWNDIVDWDCTLFQYIGEICRYLLHTESAKPQVSHRIRMCCGNGLRGDIWEAFKKRFHIPNILEFYASTEGTFSLFNVEGKPGAIGRIPPFLAHRFPAKVVKFDFEKNEPIRNEQGFCVPCEPNEIGEAIGLIGTDDLNPATRFDGYINSEASEQKILRSVFEPNDKWFRTGDLMRQDEKGYFYFIDRIGDTFRWKGENVSTTEVSGAICTFSGVKDAAVYGVTIPGTDGRAGMAAITADEIDLAAFHSHLSNRLPQYARPIFLRLRLELDVTATFKHKKSALVRDGFDPDSTKDSIYFNDPGQGGFVALDKSLFNRIQTGQIRL